MILLLCLCAKQKVHDFIAMPICLLCFLFIKSWELVDQTLIKIKMQFIKQTLIKIKMQFIKNEIHFKERLY